MWKKILIQGSNIAYKNEHSVLIKMPNNSKYKGCVFWHPLKLIRAESGYYDSFSFEENFDFKIYKDKKLIATLCSEEIEDIFSNFYKKGKKDKRSFLRIEEPEKINDNEKVVVPDCLKNK